MKSITGICYINLTNNDFIFTNLIDKISYDNKVSLMNIVSHHKKTFENKLVTLLSISSREYDIFCLALVEDFQINMSSRVK